MSPPIPDEERAYYLATFAGRTLVVGVLHEAALGECRHLAEELRERGARVVLVEPGPNAGPVEDADVVDVWRTLNERGTATIRRTDVRSAAERIAEAGRVHKLVFVGERLILRDRSGERRSFVDVATAGLPAAIMDVAAPLYRGVEGVNLCEPGRVAEELLTYRGSGTLLTLGDYGEVRPLGFDDYAAVAALLRRGSDLGYLRERSSEEIEAVLPRALGFFVSGGSPAGVVALESDRYAGTGYGELECLFTISRFHGEGVGRRLVEALEDKARDSGLGHLLAVTTNDEAADFFRNCRFDEVGPDEIPDAKWVSYPADRRRSVRCFTLDL